MINFSLTSPILVFPNGLNNISETIEKYNGDGYFTTKYIGGYIAGDRKNENLRHTNGTIDMTNLFMLTTTVETKDHGEKLAEQLLEEHLIGCCQITGPITSLYRWQGKMVKGEEFVLTIKTTGAKINQVREWLQANHPYEVPEIVSREIESINESYALWLKKECNE
jgi:periplasmic divalent cation tolerance protein